MFRECVAFGREKFFRVASRGKELLSLRASIARSSVSCTRTTDKDDEVEISRRTVLLETYGCLSAFSDIASVPMDMVRVIENRATQCNVKVVVVAVEDSMHGRERASARCCCIKRDHATLSCLTPPSRAFAFRT